MRRMQREEVRERRRTRDRQRRQSMTLEQRERHLARRRRNYQLRRLRAETTRLDSTTAISHDQAVNSPPEEVITSQADHGFNLNPIGFEKLSSECLQSAGLETLLAQKAVKVMKRLRLSHLRCLARSLNRFGGGVGGIHEKEAAVLSKRDADTTLQFGEKESSGLPRGLRLNRIKRLARGLSVVNHEINGQSHQVEQNGVVSSGENEFGHTDHC